MKRRNLTKIVSRSLLLIALVCASASLASAEVFTVTRSDDRDNASCVSGDCSLREAVKSANAAFSDDIINFPSGVTSVTLTGEIIISNRGKLKISGAGADFFKIDGGAGQNRIFYISGATVEFINLTLTGGNGAGVTFNLNGGAIYSSGGSLTLDHVHVRDNTATTGGPAAGIFFFSGKHRILNSTFSNNITTTSCGAFFNSGGNITIVNSTFHNNSAGTGGAICNSGDLIMRNTTISGNTASRGGGGVLEFGSNTIDIGNSIVAGNNAPSGPPEIWANAPITSRGNNIIGDSPGDAATTDFALVYDASDILDTPPLLDGSLKNNGGTTPSLALLDESPAIDRGNNNHAVDPSNSNLRLVTDQRSYRRTVDGNGDGTATVDIGAYEYRSTSITTANISGRVTARFGSAARVQINLTNVFGETRTAYTNPFGYYRFKDVPVGSGYNFTLKSKQYTFSPQPVTITGDSDSFNFTPQYSKNL